MHHVFGVAILHPGNTHAPSSGSFVTMYLAELPLGNEYMEIGLPIENSDAGNDIVSDIVHVVVSGIVNDVGFRDHIRYRLRCRKRYRFFFIK